MSRARYPPASEQGNQFGMFVDNEASCIDADRLALPFLGAGSSGGNAWIEGISRGAAARGIMVARVAKSRLKGRVRARRAPDVGNLDVRRCVPRR